MKNILLITFSYFLLVGVAFSQNNIDKLKENISRKWVLNKIKLEKTLYDSEVVQSRAGVKNILEFAASGKCYVRDSKGKKLQENAWAFSEDGSRLIIQSSEDGESQAYLILKLTAKELALELEDKNGNQIFVYAAVKE